MNYRSPELRLRYRRPMPLRHEERERRGANAPVFPVSRGAATSTRPTGCCVLTTATRANIERRRARSLLLLAPSDCGHEPAPDCRVRTTAGTWPRPGWRPDQISTPVPARQGHRDFVGQSQTRAQRRRRKSGEGRRLRSLVVEAGYAARHVACYRGSCLARAAVGVRCSRISSRLVSGQIGGLR